jgi:hypothetical protein
MPRTPLFDDELGRLLAFAKTGDGVIWKVDAAEKGRDYFCAGCERPVILRKGEHRIIHFAHKSSADGVGCNRETWEHKTSKLVMVQRVNLSSIGKAERPILCRSCPKCYALSREPLLAEIVGASVKEMRTPAGFVADVPFLDAKNDFRWGGEVRKSHAVDKNKAENYDKPFLEVMAGDILEDDLNWRLLQDTFPRSPCENCERLERQAREQDEREARHRLRLKEELEKQRIKEAGLRERDSAERAEREARRQKEAAERHTMEAAAVEDENALTASEIEEMKALGDAEGVPYESRRLRPYDLPVEKQQRRFVLEVKQVIKRTGVEPPPTFFRHGLWRCCGCHCKILVFAWPGCPPHQSNPPVDPPSSVQLRALEAAGGASQWVNTCPKCGVAQDDHLLYTEAKGPFWNMPEFNHSEEAWASDMATIIRNYYLWFGWSDTRPSARRAR